MGRLQVRRAGYALGAVAVGVDLSAPLDPDDLAAIRTAYRNHIVLCFPGQALTPEQLMSLAANFGDLCDNDRAPRQRDPEHPEIMWVSNRADISSGKPVFGYRMGRKWHSDYSFSDRPGAATLLNAKAIPAVGGDTIFNNMYTAYETLSPAMRSLVDGLEAVHDITKGRDFATKPLEHQESDRRLNPPVIHPVVRVHPDTGRHALYLGERIGNFVGMSAEETRPLLAFLLAHATAYELTYRHRWNVNDLVMWDNRCAMHIAVADYDPTAVRHMLRCSTLGERIGRVVEPERAAVPA